ncbi:MAG: hypothetical protein Q8K59_07150 [Nitrosomonas sp.]|nr:hypothetical protein [Nitrosomonas sp.]MDP1950853.1 hypothetical protein [Nitrosomonas sp.]
MDSAEKKRKTLLGVALLATLLAVVWVGEEEEEAIIDSVPTAQPTRVASGQARNNERNTVEYLAIDQLGQRKFNAKAGELFKSTSWVPQHARLELPQATIVRQEIQPPAPPPAPTPPPLPFKYIGKAIAENETWVFLSQSGENHIAKLGGHIDNQYRIDAVNDEAVTFTYLPLNTKQTLTINNQMAGNIR